MLPSNPAFAPGLQKHFTADELAVVERVILGPETPDDQAYTFQKIDRVSIPGEKGEVSLSRELLKVLSLVALTGKRVVGVMDGGKFLQVSVDVVTADKRVEGMRRRVRFQIIENSGDRVREYGAKSRNMSDDHVDELELTKRSPRFFNDMRGEKRQPIPRKDLSELARVITEKGSVAYNPKQALMIYEYLKRFKEAYFRAVTLAGEV